ncbi:hypothetical protein FACS1894198_6330 [Clostridia bacterium]|nr:hypothetical protein FACS1894198_6330 [Clostridia bacterium]
MKIIAPTKITGYHAGLMFVAGIGATEDEWLIHWFKSHGYTVEGTSKPAKKEKREVATDAEG